MLFSLNDTRSEFCFWVNDRYGWLEEDADEESPYTEWDNLQKEPIQEDITNNSFELLQTIKELKLEMESVKKENEWILWAQEELNQILIERFHTEGRGKRIEFEDIGYQHKDKKTKQVKNESSSSSEVYGDLHKQNFHYTSDSSEDNHHTRKIKFKPYEEISGDFKKINPTTFNAETEKGKKQNPGCPRWRNTSKIITTLINWRPRCLFIIS